MRGCKILSALGELPLKPKTQDEINYHYSHVESNYNFLKQSKPKHNFSLVLIRKSNCVVVSCIDYPLCSETITIFSKRDE